jgi:hypothetical protein
VPNNILVAIPDDNGVGGGGGILGDGGIRHN